MNPIQFDSHKDQQLLQLLNYQGQNANPLKQILLCPQSQFIEQLALVDEIKAGFVQTQISSRTTYLCLFKLYNNLKDFKEWKILNSKVSLFQLFKLVQRLANKRDKKRIKFQMWRLIISKVTNPQPLIYVFQQKLVYEHLPIRSAEITSKSAIQWFLKLSYQTLKGTVIEKPWNQKIEFQQMSQVRKKSLICKIIKVYSHIILKDQLADFEYQALLENLQQDQISVVCDLLTINSKKTEQVTKKLLDFKLEPLETGIIFSTEVKLGKNIVSSSLFNAIFKSSSGGFDFLKVQNTNEEQKKIILRFNLLDFEEDVFSNILPYAMIQRGERKSDDSAQVQKFNLVFMSLLSILRKSAQGWHVFAYTYKQGEVKLLQYSKEEKLRLIEICMLIWKNIYDLADLTGQFHYWDQEYVTFNKMLEKASFQTKHFIEIFIIVLNLEDIPKIQTINHISFIINRLQQFDRKMFTEIVRVHIDFMHLFVKKTSCSIQKYSQKERIIPYDMLAFLLLAESEAEDLSLKGKNSPLNSPQVFQFVYNMVFFHDHYDYCLVYKPYFYNLGQNRQQQRLNLQHRFYQSFNDFKNLCHLNINKELERLNKFSYISSGKITKFVARVSMSLGEIEENQQTAQKLKQLLLNRPDLFKDINRNVIDKIIKRAKIDVTTRQKYLLEQLLLLLNKDSWKTIDPSVFTESFLTDNPLLLDLRNKLYSWKVLVSVDHKLRCTDNFELYQKFIISLKKIQFILKEKIALDLTDWSRFKLQQRMSFQRLIRKSHFDHLFMIPAKDVLSKFQYCLCRSNIQFIINFLTQGHSLINQINSNQTDYYCLRGSFQLFWKILNQLNEQNICYGIILYQKFKKQILGVVQSIFVKLSANKDDKNNDNNDQWDMDYSQFQITTMNNILIDKRQENDPVDHYYHKVKLQSYQHIQHFFKAMIRISQSATKVFVGKKQYRGYKNIIKVQKSWFIDFLTNFQQNCAQQNLIFYLTIVKEFFRNIKNLANDLYREQQDQQIQSSLDLPCEIQIYLGNNVDQILSESILKFLSKLILFKVSSEEQAQLKNLVTELLQNTPNKQILQKHKEGLFSEMLKKIEEYCTQEEPKMQVLRVYLDWVNLFLTFMKNASISKLITTPFIQSYTKYVKWLISKGNQRKQELQLTIPLLQRIVPIISHAQENEQVIKFTLHLAKIIAKTLQILQPLPQENILNSLIFKIIGSESHEIVKYANFFTLKTNKEQVPSLICQYMNKYELYFSIQADIKAYFLKLMVQTNCSQNQIQADLKSLTKHFKNKYAQKLKQFKDGLFKLALKKENSQNPQNPSFIYQNKDPFSFSRVKSAQFINYKPGVFIKCQIIQNVNKIVQNAKENKSHFSDLQKIVRAHGTLLPYILFHSVKGREDSKVFLDFLINTAMQSGLQNLNLREFLLLSCLDMYVIKGKRSPIFLSYFVIGQILKKLLSCELNINSLFLIFELSQLKVFCLLSNLSIRQSQSLREKVQQFLIKSRKQFQYQNNLNILCLAILSTFHRYYSLTNLAQKIQPTQYEFDKDYRPISDCIVPFGGVIASMGEKHFKYNSFSSGLCLLEQLQGLDVIVNDIKEDSEALNIEELSLEGLQIEANFQVKEKLLMNIGCYCQLKKEEQTRYGQQYFRTGQNRIYNEAIYFMHEFYNTDKENRSQYDGKVQKILNQRSNFQDEDQKKRQGEFQDFSPTRFAAQDFTNLVNDENEEEDDDLDLKVQKMFKKSFLQGNQSSTQSAEKKQKEKIILTEQMNQIIYKINANLACLKREEFKEYELDNKSIEQALQMLRTIEIETEFDIKEQTLSQTDFEAYCLANVSRLQKLTSKRRDKIKEMEEYMLMRYIRRTSSSDSIDYIIDTLDQNYQLLNKIDRKFTKKSEDSANYKPRQIKKERSILSTELQSEYFSEISQELIFDIVMSLYNYSLLLQVELLIPFLQNKKAQAKLVTTLLFVYKNPFNNKIFPAQLKYYGGKALKQPDQELKYFKQRILKLVYAFNDYAFYEEKTFLTEEIPLNGIKDIKIQQSSFIKQFFSSDKYIPKLQLFHQAIDLDDNILNKTNKIIFFSGLKHIPDCFVDRTLDFLQELNKEFDFLTGKEQNVYSLQINRFFQYKDKYKWHEHLKTALNVRLLIQKIRNKYPVTQQLSWSPFMFCLFIQTEVYSRQQLKKVYQIVLKRGNVKSSSIFYCNQGLRLYTDEQIAKNIIFKQYKEFISTAFSIYIPKINLYSKMKKQPFFRLVRFPSLLTIQSKSVILKMELEKKINRIVYYRSQQILAKRKKGIFESAFQDLRHKPNKFWMNDFRVRFLDDQGKNESGMGEGVRKQWYTLVTKGMVNLDYGLFMKTSKNYYYFNRQSWINPRHLQFFEFIGKLFALTFVFPKYSISPSFSIIIYKMILKEKIQLQDIIDEFDEGQVIINLEKMRDIKDDSLLCQTFVYNDKKLVSDKRQKINTSEGQGSLYLLKETQYLPSQQEVEEPRPNKTLKVLKVGESIELVPGGAHIAVTMDNLQEFIRLTKEKIYEIILKGVEKQYSAFIEGLKKVIDVQYLEIFTASQLRGLAQGTEKIQVQQLKDNVRISVRTCQKCLQLFWEVMTELNGQQRLHFLHHWTGIPKIPANGVKNMNLQISQRLGEKKRIFAQTCFNTIYLPEIQTKEQVREAVLLAIATVKQGVSIIQD